MTSLVRTPVVSLLLVALALTGRSAAAQDLLFIGDAAIGSAGRFGERLGSVPAAVHGTLVDGGRIVVEGTTAYDTRTGQATAIPGTVLAGDPLLPRVFISDGQQVAAFRIDTGQVTPLLSLMPFASTRPSALYAPLADRLLIHRELTPGSHEVVVVDVASAAVVRAFPAVWTFTFGWTVTPDGQRLTVRGTTSYQTYPSGLLLIDTESGAVLTSPPDRGVIGFGTVIDDRHFERTYALSRSEVTVFDDQLRFLGAVAVRSSCAQPSMAVSAHTGRVYVVDSVGGGQVYGQPVPIHHYLSVFDGANGAFIDSREITDAAGVPAGSNSCSELPITVITAPGAPKQFAASVSGHDLSLSWRDGGGITAGYVLEVGLAPGQTALTIDLGGKTSASFANVPPGRYVARLRAINPFGVSRPSSDVVIVVP